MASVSLTLVWVAASLALGCTRPEPQPPQSTASPDAPYDLADDDDLALIRDHYGGALPDKRSELRASLSAEYSKRAAGALGRNEPAAAYANYVHFLGLFEEPSELTAQSTQLRSAEKLAVGIRKVHARRGADHQVALALYHLAAVNPTNNSAHLSELDAIFHYSDELAVAKHGPGAERSRPIAILEKVVAVAPFPRATDRLLKLYTERHAAISAIIRAGDLSYELIAAHGQGVLQSTRLVVRTHAVAQTLELAPASLASMTGFGDDPTLRELLAAAVVGGAPEIIALAEHFISEDDKESDLPGALAILEWGRSVHPDDSSLVRTQGLVASKANQLALGIRLLEAGIQQPPRDQKAAAELAELYEFRVTTLALGGRPTAAADVLIKFEEHYRSAAQVWPTFTPDLANAYAAMGRGLLSLGELGRAEKVLTRSLGARTNFEALEHLGTLALRRDQFTAAADHFERALSLPANDPSVRFNRTKLLRLAGEAYAGAEQPDKAFGMYMGALDEWRKLRTSETFALREPFAAEALVESGKLLWHIGKRDTAIAAFAAAQDSAPTDANTVASIVSFLIVRDRYDAALDAYHRALGSAQISEYFKVYMGLWLLAESRRRGASPDPFVSDYLNSRNGSLWQHDLARFASGREKLGSLAKRATTKARRAELLYYNAVLGVPSASAAERDSLLRDVVASGMVMFFEYEMAKHWLSRGQSNR